MYLLLKNLEYIWNNIWQRKHLITLSIVTIIIVLTTTLLSTYYSHFTGEEMDSGQSDAIYNGQSQHF